MELTRRAMHNDASVLLDVVQQSKHSEMVLRHAAVRPASPVEVTHFGRRRLCDVEHFQGRHVDVAVPLHESSSTVGHSNRTIREVHYLRNGKGKLEQPVNYQQMIIKNVQTHVVFFHWP